MNISFRSCTESFETETPSGKLLFQLIGSVAEFERNTIVENVKLGMKAKAKNGEWNGGIILGYDFIKDPNSHSKSKKSCLIIKPEEASIIREIFELYASGKGLKAITNIINYKGYKTKKGNPFNVNGVRDILMNPTYIGKIRFNVRENWAEKRRKGINPEPIIVDGQHEAIIPMGLWEKVHQIYDKKKGRPKRVFDGTFPLTGILRCPVCNSGMVAQKTSKKRKDGSKHIIRYYVCGSFKNKGSSVCASNCIRADYVEEYVFSRLKKVLSQERLLKDVVKRVNLKRDNQVKPLENELCYIEDQLNKLSKTQEKYFDLFEKDAIDPDTLSNRLKQVQVELSKYTERKEAILSELNNNDTLEVPYDLVQSVLSHFDKALDQAPPNQKKLLLQLILNKITIKDNKKIDSIEMQFDKRIIHYLLDNDNPPSPDGGFFNVYQDKGLQLFMVRFTIT